jgi:hypothetical protein
VNPAERLAELVFPGGKPLLLLFIGEEFYWWALVF